MTDTEPTQLPSRDELVARARLFEAAGAHEIYLSGHMQRCFRDVYAATAHTGLGWDRVAVEYGRHQVGLSFGAFKVC
jgi:hypothetical protein